MATTMRQRGGYGGDKPVFSFADNRGVEMTSVAPDASDTTARGGAPRMAHRAVASDVTLQMLISFNVYFSVCFWVATVVATFVKTNGAREDFDEIRPVMICMYAVFEPARLYAGFAGNLQEQVPMLIGFVALSFCVALPLHFYFLAGQMGVGGVRQGSEPVRGGVRRRAGGGWGGGGAEDPRVAVALVLHVRAAVTDAVEETVKSNPCKTVARQFRRTDLRTHSPRHA